MSHVDSPSPVTHVSLCAGYGGIDLGLHRAVRNLRTIAVSEIEGFACANLVAKMEAGLLDPAPIWTDLKTFPWSDFRDRVDILSGGYPCQPFSAAGKRLGAEDPRHLWPFISAGIALMRPSVCFFENVEGHISLGLPDVIEDLGRLGYRATWCVASASECGAPHQRKRIFILAYRHGERGQLPDWWREPAEQVPVGYGETWRDDLDNPNAMAAGGVAGLLGNTQGEEQGEGLQRQRTGHTAGYAGQDPWPSRPSELVNAEHLGHDAAKIDGGHPAGADSRWTQEPQVHGQSARGCGDVWPSRPGEPQHAWEPPRVVVDVKGQRAGQRSELRSEECGSGSALSWDVEQSGEGAVANDHSAHAGHGEQRPERTLGDLSGGCGEAMDDAARLRGPEPADGRGQAASWADASGEARLAAAQGSERRITVAEDNSGRRIAQARGSNGEGQRQTQPPLGRDADGPADWLDDAELYVTCDNRTDELRLLGNGVVPACAERAFRLLVGELAESEGWRESANG